MDIKLTNMLNLGGENMNEDMLYDKVDFIADHEGDEKAYKFLIENKENVENPTAYLDFDVFRMAAKLNHNEDALKYMEESIIHKKLWYSGHIFNYDVFKNISDTNRFKACRELSEQRYNEFMKDSDAYYSWKSKSVDKLKVFVHGDSGSLGISKEQWKFLNNEGYQVEYVVSKYPWTINHFRWMDDAKPQLPSVFKRMDGESYKEVILYGFSAGPNEILKSILVKPDICNKIFLVTPWLAITTTHGEELAEKIAEQNIEVIMYCSKVFEEEMEMMNDFEKLLIDKGVKVKTIRSEDETCEFPQNPEEIFKGLI